MSPPFRSFSQEYQTVLREEVRKVGAVPEAVLALRRFRVAEDCRTCVFDGPDFVIWGARKDEGTVRFCSENGERRKYRLSMDDEDVLLRAGSLSDIGNSTLRAWLAGADSS